MRYSDQEEIVINEIKTYCKRENDGFEVALIMDKEEMRNKELATKNSKVKYQKKWSKTLSK